MTFLVGDLVTPIANTKKLKQHVIYEINKIIRCADGNYDWDDIFLEGVDGAISEYDLDLYRRL